MYRASSTTNFNSSFYPNKGKTITQLLKEKEGIFTHEKTIIYDSPNGSSTGNIFHANVALTYLDHKGDFLYAEGEQFDENGNSLGIKKGWIKISSTNFNPTDPAHKKVIMHTKVNQEIEAYKSMEDDILKEHNQKALEDYNKKHPNQLVESYDNIPEDEQLIYVDRKNEIYAERFKKEVQIKKELAERVVDLYEKNYGLKSIFDPQAINEDKNKEENEREYADSDFSGENAKISMGYYPEKDQTAHDILDMGNEWMATMEVLYDKDRAQNDEFVMKQIVMNFPLTKLIDETRIQNTGFELSEEKLEDKMNLLSIMIAHEYIHSAQNTKIVHQDIANLPNLKSDEIKRARYVRELLAYHFTVFPNKKYDDPKNDPVFFSTDFVRGTTTTFGEVTEPERAFFVWKALDYLKLYREIEKTTLTEKYKINEMEKDLLAEAEAIKNGDYKIDILRFKDSNSEAFETYVKERYNSIHGSD